MNKRCLAVAAVRWQHRTSRRLHWRAPGASTAQTRAPRSVAVAGLGAVGLPVAVALQSGQLPGLVLAAASARDAVRAKARLAQALTRVSEDDQTSHATDRTELPPILPLAELSAVADIVVEAVPPNQFLDVAEPALRAGRQLVVLTATQLMLHSQRVLRAAEAGGGRIIVPTGALAGLDAVIAMLSSLCSGLEWSSARTC
eukprot:SAG31_NODE_5509_length_2491_cov_1.987040_4_plen_200_part_00